MQPGFVFRQSRARAHYLIRHWGGELSLAVSFWVNVVLVNVLAVSVERGIQTALLALPSLSPRESFRRGVSWFVIREALGLAVTTWQIVGTWRSAHRSATGWATLTQLCMAMMGLKVATTLIFFEAPALVAQFAHVRESELELTWQVRVLRAATEMEVSGGIGSGFASDLARVLATEPRIRVIHVNLERGGLIAEAVQAQSILHRHARTTYVTGTCTSACTLVFLGGTERLLKKGAKLGFHTVRSPGSDAQTLATLRERTRSQMVEAGVNAEFAERAMGTPAESMWYPDEQQLLAAGVVTAITEGYDLAATSGKPPASIEEARSGLDEVRLYRVIKSVHPQRYDEITLAVQQGLARGRSINEMRSVVVPILEPLLAQAVPRASDASLLELADLLRRQLEELQRAPPELCAELVRTGNAAGTYEYMSKESRQQELEILADVIESAGHPASPLPKMPDQRETERLLARAARLARKKVGIDITGLAGIDSHGLDPSEICRAALGLYAGIAELPSDARAKLVRALLARR